MTLKIPFIKKRVLFSFLFLVSAISAQADSAPVDWPTLGYTRLVSHAFSQPTCLAHAGDNSGRLFVAEQTGRVWIIQSNNVLTQPFLDISPRVLSAGNEQGLLDVAFSPGFSTNNYFYVNYTRQTDGAVVVSRFFLTSTNSNVADTNSEQIVLVIPKPYNNHNGGQIAFGPNGYLYIGVGDGGSEGDPLNNGQKSSTLLGKILRIDVESGVAPYAIPPGNPFAGNTNFAPEIWAWGLRNPWRFSFDDLTGDLYIGDVGQNQYEEIDFQPAGSTGGQNYGWRIMEGNSNYNVPAGFTNFSALTLPVSVYTHASLPTDLAAAVVGGYVYRGPTNRLNGFYFYGDYVAGWIWEMRQIGTNWQTVALVNPNFFQPPPVSSISTFGEDDQGKLYMADYSGGAIYQLRDSLQAWPPFFSPPGGTINSNTVILSCLSTGVVVHLTTNGLIPGLSDPIIAANGTLQVSSGVTYLVKAYRSDLTPTVNGAVFTLQVGTPVFNPPAGQVSGGTAVSISSVTPGANFYYTTDGSTPTTNALLYTGPLVLNGDETLRALGVAPGYSNSIVATASYSVVSTAMPSLQITASTNQVILSWPIWADTFVLETGSNLPPDATWIIVTSGVAASVNYFVLTNPIGPANAFYRLRQP
jgi:glucose/arabinose dehydrogenase